MSRLKLSLNISSRNTEVVNKVIIYFGRRAQFRCLRGNAHFRCIRWTMRGGPGEAGGPGGAGVSDRECRLA